jgi:hypothetical protein
MNLQLHRPPGYSGIKEDYLSDLAQDTVQFIQVTQRNLTHKTLRLKTDQLEKLASVIVEFAEDVHNDIGIWKSLEHYNIEYFGTPLPFVLKPYQEMGSEAINKSRLQHLLWIIYPQLNAELILSPTHHDLEYLAAEIASFLEKRFVHIAPGSSIKTFLAGANKFAWEVKKKLIWLGTHSYLFRISFQNYVKEQGGKFEVPVIDDFICQHTSEWSGLGVIDILAAMLDISEKQRLTLRSWYERHLAYYRILAIQGQCSELANMINNKPYSVMISNDTKQFKVGTIVFGSLVPWNKKWYWSGQQYLLDGIATDDFEDQKAAFLKKSSQIAYRYCSDEAEKARKSVQRHYREFVNYHNADLVVYPDGLSMAADYQKEIRLQWESRPKEEIAEVVDRLKLAAHSASLSFPEELLKTKNGVGLYFNPDEGHEIMTEFNDIVRGFKKKGLDLSEDEGHAIRSFIISDSISPQFVKWLIKEYGSESVESAFLIRGEHNKFGVEYLLRRYKGAYYRNRYPRLALV